MKYLLTILLSLFSIVVFGQSLVGAWEWKEMRDGVKLKGVVIFSDKYQAAAWYDSETGAFIETNGGLWSINGNIVTETVEFSTRNSEENVGKEFSFEIEWDGENKMRIVGEDFWSTRIDSGDPGVLAGAWLMSGRIRDGEVQNRETNRPRKTMKILSGTRFQWIAYNTETKKFMGTGGGTYTTENGKYTENIEFFSRDDNKVGLSLEFNYEIKEGRWHHSGNNSRGEPMYELWSIREN